MLFSPKSRCKLILLNLVAEISFLGFPVPRGGRGPGVVGVLQGGWVEPTATAPDHCVLLYAWHQL